MNDLSSASAVLTNYKLSILRICTTASEFQIVRPYIIQGFMINAVNFWVGGWGQWVSLSQCRLLKTIQTILCSFTDVISELVCHCLLLGIERQLLTQDDQLALCLREDQNSLSPSFLSGAFTTTPNCLMWRKSLNS